MVSADWVIRFRMKRAWRSYCLVNPYRALSFYKVTGMKDVCTLAFDIERIYLYVTDCI
jgi:hypothetical protein